VIEAICYASLFVNVVFVILFTLAIRAINDRDKMGRECGAVSNYWHTLYRDAVGLMTANPEVCGRELFLAHKRYRARRPHPVAGDFFGDNK
jgi:hypothetical protein